MDSSKEYHDPDYPEVAVCSKQASSTETEEEKISKIRQIICREFSKEIETRENEVTLLNRRLSKSRRLLHRLRYSVVNRYFNDQKLQITNTQIQDEIATQKDPQTRAQVASILRDSQRGIHPSLRKLLGKETIDVGEILRAKGPRNRQKRDYLAMLNNRNYTISADATKSLRPSGAPPPAPLTPSAPSTPPKKTPRQKDPKITNVVTLDEATRNQMKHRYRIIIGNTSKYVPSSSASDRSTHKWLLYVRPAPPPAPAPVSTAPVSSATGSTAPVSNDPGPTSPDAVPPILTAVTLTLHHSYAPHHIVHLDKPPFQVSRRGWGEFPARVELHFPLPRRNKPATIHHNIKLDRNYTGVQVLGSETVVDVWLYSTPEMIQYSLKEEEAEQTHTPTQHIKQEPSDDHHKQTDWMDFFKTPTELDIDQMLIKPIKNETTPINTLDNDLIVPESQNELILTESQNDLEVPDEILSQPEAATKRIVKYINPTTGKVYYLEMDRELDLSTVQEIVINNTANKISPLNGLKKNKKKGVSILKPIVKDDFSHIENDHCYLATPRNNVATKIKKEEFLYERLCANMSRFSDVKSAVHYLVKHIPLISSEARDPDFVKHFPFVVENSAKYWKLDFAKRRNIEWSRAKLINRILSENFPKHQTWRTKQILMYLRIHGHHPFIEDTLVKTENEKDQSIKQNYPQASDICTLTAFKFDIDSCLNDSAEVTDEDVDVLGEVKREVKKERVSESEGSLEVLPVESEDDRLRFMYIERKCADIGIELRNEDIGSGYKYSAVHAVILSAVKSFAEEMIRNALATQRIRQYPAAATSVWHGINSSPGCISLAAMYEGCARGRLAFITAQGLAHTNTL